MLIAIKVCVEKLDHVEINFRLFLIFLFTPHNITHHVAFSLPLSLSLSATH